MALHTVNTGSVSRQPDLFDVNARALSRFRCRDSQRLGPIAPVTRMGADGTHANAEMARSGMAWAFHEVPERTANQGD
jgi:hypothetical protein